MAAARRMKVRLPDEDAYQTARSALAIARVHVYVQSDRRRTLSVDEMPEQVRSQLESLGAEIVDDVRYEPDSAF
jgi:hypothetical protein